MSVVISTVELNLLSDKSDRTPITQYGDQIPPLANGNKNAAQAGNRQPGRHVVILDAFVPSPFQLPPNARSATGVNRFLLNQPLLQHLVQHGLRTLGRLEHLLADQIAYREPLH